MFSSLLDSPPLGKETPPVEKPVSSVWGNHKAFLALLVAAAILAVGARIYVARVVLPDGLCDDCYTTLRYAANLSQGKGFVFNDGEWVWGTTTPLFTLLLYPVGALFGGGGLETATITINIVASVVFWLFLLAIFENQRVPRPVSLSVLLLVMFGPAFFGNSLSGMETPVVLALMAASFYCFITNRSVTLGILLGLLVLARIDTLIWIGILGLAYIVRHIKEQPRMVLTGILTFLLVIAPWHIFALMKFGTLIPQTVPAKALTNNVLHESYEQYAVELCRVYFPAGGLFDTPLKIAGLFALLAIGAVVTWKQYPLLRPLPVFFFAFVAYLVVAKVQRFPWYFPPTQWLGYLLGLMAIYFLWNQVIAARANQFVRGLPWAFVLALTAVHCIRGDYHHYQDRCKHNPWIDVANYIAANTTPDNRVFLEHIGLVGHRSKRPILDNIGLVSPEMVDVRKKYRDHWLVPSLRQFTPEVVVLYAWDLPDGANGPWSQEDRDWFSAKYQLANVVAIDDRMITYIYFDKSLPGIPSKKS